MLSSEFTETIIDEVIKGISITGVGVFTVERRELVEALHSDGAEVARVCGVLC